MPNTHSDEYLTVHGLPVSVNLRNLLKMAGAETVFLFFTGKQKRTYAGFSNDCVCLEYLEGIF